MSMQCSEARKLLGPDPGPRPSSPETADAFDHYEGCAACRALFENHRRLAARLRRLSEAQQAPQDLRDRITAAIAQEGHAPPAPAERPAAVTPIRRARRWWAGGLVAAAAAVTVLVSVGRVDPIDPLLEEAVTVASGESIITTTEFEPLSEWFASQQVASFEIPQIADAQLRRGRVALIDGMKAAVIDFTMNGVELTYFMIPTRQYMDEMAEIDIVSLEADGYEVAMWEEDGTSRAIVSTMQRDELLAVAEQCKYKRIS